MIGSAFGAFLLVSTLLPLGPPPNPVTYAHFPDTLHTFIWRNWELVPLERMAETVGASENQILAIGKSMGLPDPAPISSEQLKRSYITIIRRNWHLLPYNQLLSLLEWNEARLAFTLREDDFLYSKLGKSKPDCPPVRYLEPGPSTRKRSREIAGVFENIPLPKKRDPLFSFVKNLSSPYEAPPPPKQASMFSPRFCSSYFATYGDPLLKDEPDPYPDGYLARLEASGVNGIWLQGVLYKLTPFPWQPELSERWEERLEKLKELTERAAKHNIGVYLYLNEPRGMPLDFFKGRENLKGVIGGTQGGAYAALCVSTPEVDKYLESAVTLICKSVPKLAGIFTITASENLTNCWSHGHGADCPRCRKRGPEEVISGVNHAIQRGIDKAGAKTRLIVWDWGWQEKWTPGIIEKLPEKSSFMSVSEWSIPIKRGGIPAAVNEYSLSVNGPGPRATKNWGLALEKGLPALAKLQVNNTWEISTVPYVPAVANIATHIASLRGRSIQGLMLGWTLGGHPSPNLEVAAELGRSKTITAREAMLQVASERYGNASAESVVNSWEAISTAFREFPFDNKSLYLAPFQRGASNLLYETQTGYRATMVGFCFDDLENWRSVYPPEIFISQIRKVAKGFRQGLAFLNQAYRQETDPGNRKSLEEEIRITETCAIHFESTANQSRFILDRDALLASGDQAAADKLIAKLKHTLEAELKLASRLYSLQYQDSRLGFEASNHYYYVPLDLAEKVVNCRYLLSKWLPEQEARFAGE